MSRLLSAVVLLVLVVGTIWLLPPAATVVLAACAAGVAFTEYARLAAALGAPVPSVVTGAAVVGTCLAMGSTVVPVELVLMSAVIVIGSIAVAAGRPGSGILQGAAAAAWAILYIGVPLGSLAAVRVVAGREAVLLLLATLVVSDSAQFYCGRAFGRTPLAPAVSPKKTVEGAIGGCVFGTAAMAIGGAWVFPGASRPILLLLSATIVLLGIVGDLFESLLKRSAGVKDTSGLIPGHGGMLDRIDSWLFASPMYYVFARYLQV
ncbi:MAG TPA: phosphatidate cytidylyltransferase [Vicinamibacterales bacterium]|nr:phosphatidate cytidylyltransferase [Vicinamibacterales bacterium]